VFAHKRSRPSAIAADGAQVALQEIRVAADADAGAALLGEAQQHLAAGGVQQLALELGD